MALAVNKLIGFGARKSAGGNDAFTQLLLHMDGADASTTFTDSSGNAFTVTVAGNAQIDNAQSEFGGTGGLFDGTGDFLTLGGQSNFAFGTGDFTVDFWMRISAGNNRALYDSRPSGVLGVYPMLLTDGSNHLLYNVNGTQITGTTVLSAGAWYHVALARSGTSTKLFLNGTQEGSTYSDSNTYLNGAARPMIGASGWDNGTAFGFAGWFDELRVSKGIARWTASFTPPTLPYS